VKYKPSIKQGPERCWSIASIYENSGMGSLSDLVINDTIPVYTELKGGANCGQLFSGLSCSSMIDIDEGLKWVFIGALVGGESGSVSVLSTH